MLSLWCHQIVSFLWFSSYNRYHRHLSLFAGTCESRYILVHFFGSDGKHLSDWNKTLSLLSEIGNQSSNLAASTSLSGGQDITFMIFYQRNAIEFYIHVHLASCIICQRHDSNIHETGNFAPFIIFDYLEFIFTFEVWINKGTFISRTNFLPWLRSSNPIDSLFNWTLINLESFIGNFFDFLAAAAHLLFVRFY